MRDPVGPDGFLKKHARTKDVFFGTCPPKQNPKEAQMALGSIKSTLEQSVKSVVLYRGWGIWSDFVGSQRGWEIGPEQHVSHVWDGKTSVKPKLVFK